MAIALEKKIFKAELISTLRENKGFEQA